ncbi:MAG: hypothetical protein KKB13_30185 [Chloroflexi bacterium]|nr:hypothetical protein [Chloroflexota bacterium]MBU1878411.1 hypothetical protein [Chloroflexota bacterium]
MSPQTKRLLGIMAFTLLYPLLGPVVQYIPNPMVPGAIVALNMILPVLAGYFYGPVSGAVVGGVGTALAALLWVDPFDGLAIFPHIVMGALAGWTGKQRSELLSSAMILVGHALNMLFYLRLGLITISLEEVGVTALGLAAETMIDIIAIVLVIILLKRWLYHEERW